jgi:alkyl hydroperoxide reductase subunit AhpF
VSVLAERDEEAIRAVFGALERDVEVLLELGPAATPVTLLAAGGREVDPCEQTRVLVEAVCALSARVHLEVVEHERPGSWPQTTIGDGLVYRGMPVGYELGALVHGIAETGREGSALAAASLDLLAELDRDVELRVYVTPT